jgi:hypothetical protein
MNLIRHSPDVREDIPVKQFGVDGRMVDGATEGSKNGSGTCGYINHITILH